MSRYDDIDDLTCTRVGRFWHFSDGTVLPVVSGGDGPLGESPAEGGDAGADDASSAAESPDTGSETADSDPFDDEGVTQFDRAYVEKLRKENAKYRDRAKPYESAFAGYSDEAREFVLSNLVPSLISDYEGTIKALASELGITQAEAEQVVEDATQGAEEEKPLTRAEAEKLWAEREQAREAEAEAKRAQEQIVAEAKELGFDLNAGKGTREHADAQFLLILARDSFDGDLKKAAEAIEAGRQQLIAEHIEKLNAENGKAPAPVSSGAVGAKSSAAPTSLKEATAQASAYLESLGVPKRGV